MKKIYSLLMAVLLTVIGSLGAVAATTAGSVKMTYISGTDADVSTSYGEVTTAYAGYNKISNGSVALANKTWGVNNVAYLQVDASAASGPIKKVTLSGKFQQLAARGLWYGFGYNSSTWSSDLTWNTADRSITLIDGASVSCSKSSDDLEASVDITAAFKEDADKIATILVYQTAAGGGYIKDASVEVEYVSQDEKMASYTLNYINGELTVKSESDELLVGETVSTDASFFVEDAKYFRKAGEPESFTIAEGENNFSVKVRPAETFNYSLVSSLGETLASGSGIEGETVYVGYPRYQLSEGKLYEAAVTDKQFRKKLALTEDNVSATVDYAEWNGSNPVVFCAEGENINGFTVSTAGNIPVRASNAKAGTAAEDVTITSLPAGKYKLHVGTFTSKSSEQKIYIGYGENQYAFASSINLNESASEEITLTEETAIKYFGTASSTDAQFDYIYIEKTGEYSAPKADIIYTAPEAVEGLVANGEAQALITAGTVKEGGEMQYSLDGENFSTEIPTATEAKKYTVYYRIVADDTHNDVAAQEIYVTIITAELDAAQKELVAAIEAAKAIDTEGKNGAEELAAAIKTAEGVIFADDVTVSAVNTAKENLAAAVAAFEEANKVAYDITVADNIENGTVEVNPTTAKAGEEVTITATPAEGYELASISVTGQTSNLAVEVADGKFTMPADAVTVNAKFQQKAVDPSGDEEVALAADMFYTWDGYGADASKIASATVDFKVGESVDAGATVVGTGSVDYLTYADMTGSTKVIFEGKDGTAIRLLMNRQESNNGPLVEKNATIADGKAEISLTDLDFVHVNAIKIPWNGSTGNIISAIKFVKPNDPLAGPKEALKDAIAAAKMQNSVAKTEESFAALTKAITDGETALAAENATKESLTTAKSDIETAVKGLTLAEGYAEVTKEMFKQYASVDEPGEGTATNGAYELFTASGLPYGDGSVSELKWADLTKYDKFIVTVAGATAPRFCMNRLVKDGQQAATQEDSKMLDINPNNGNTWSTEKYQTASDGVYTIDLAAIVKDYSFARLHCIKAQGGGSTVVTGMYLHEAPVTYDITVADGIENGTVTVDPTTAKAGDEVTITATPAEGYELVSVSVTGVTSNEAVIVTDGKFTMPADDVTVSAKFQKKVIYIETDLTAKFNSLATTQWTGSSGQVGWAAPMVKTNTGLEVAAWERYDGSCDWTGDIMSSSVTGLVPGTYKIELYGAAAFTFDRGFGSTAFTGDFSKDKSDTYKENESIDENTGVTLYAETAEGKVSKEIPIWYATNFNTSGIATATLENVIVGESGEIKIGLSKTSTSTNWHVVQLKGVTAQVPAADVLADAVEAAKSIAESDVPAVLYSRLQQTIADYDKEYTTADGYKNAISAINSMVDIAKGYMPLSAVLNEGDQYKANVPAEDPAIAAYDAATADVKSAYDAAVVADIPAAVKVVEAALPALAKAQTAPGSDLTTLVNNTSWTCPQGNGPGKYQEIYTETYNESAYQPGKVIYQKIEGLIPGGVYEVKFLAVANTAWGKSNFGDGFAQVYANEVTSDISVIEQNNCNPTEYEQTLTAEVGDDGVFEYGMQNVAAGGNWYVVKGVSMTLKEVIISYSVDIAEGIENGTVEVSAKKAAAGEEVTITATPAEGYELASITVTGVASEEIVEVTDGKFTMPADDVTVTATFVQTTGIDAAPADKSIKADGKYFKNGKLIIIKNGKEYNAAGVAK